MDKRIYRKGYTSGVYDMFHIGHLNILKNARMLCDKLVVGVTTDELCFQRKKKYPIINQEERLQIIEAIKYVDAAIFQEDMDKLSMVKHLNADVVFVGSDWKGTDTWDRYEEEFKTIGCEVVYLDHTDGISSTILRDKLRHDE